DADGAALGLYYNNGYRGGLLANDSTLEIRGLYQSPLCFPLPCTPPPASDIVIWPVEACTGTGCILQNSPGRTGFYTTSPNSRMHIVASTGALGVTIGNRNLTPATGYMLSVGGKIICEELKVQLTNNNAWPDYVFEEKYNLPSIDAYEQQVRTQKHLPGIPSAADVQAQNGIELGEMQRKMLEKLEEMSLFIFELNKKNKQLEAEIEKLKAGKGH
ncbi:MAG TPA: hypothetical protein PKD90_05785, partial [Phnomibacter sp.]|nr:hypothetical protein [Phnomibacter sp.]